MPPSVSDLPRSIVITGASRGLGAAFARHYARPGVSLGLLARSRDDLEAVAADCRGRGADARTEVADVTDRSTLTAALTRFDDAAPCDLLIVNAGIERGPEPGAAAERPEDMARVIDVNLTGAALTAAILLPRMQARRTGHVLFVSSVAALRGLPDSPAYCASKAGLRILAESLRPRVAADGIGVTVALPGFFESAMADQWIGDKTGIVPAETMAARIADAVARGKRRVVVPSGLGWTLRVLDLLPAGLGDRLIARSRFQIDNNGRNARS